MAPKKKTLKSQHHNSVRNNSVRAMTLVIATIAGTAFASAAIITTAQDKVSNDTKSAKEALKNITPSGKAPAVQKDGMKIAALNAEEMKTAALPGDITLTGNMAQGGLVFGKTDPDARVRLDDIDVAVDADGWFALGFGRDQGNKAKLIVTFPNGAVAEQVLTIEDREFNIERIDGLPSNKVDTYTKEELDQIASSKKKKDDARVKSDTAAMWKDGFAWPLTGRISGQFGSQRILNGIEKNPHSGVDVAAPAGTDVRAPADGIITLADSSMYFEGGLIFIDHGQWVESAFMHLSRIDVKPGDRVAKGQVIGGVGMTGRATGPHMHWSLKWRNRLLDPQLIAGPMPE